MAKRYDARRYDLDCYDRNFCLKPPLLLKAIIVFLSRDFLLPVIVGLGSIKGGGEGLFDLVANLRQPYWFLTGLPALLVLYALLRRVPSGDGFARLMWRHGRTLLSLSVAAGVYPILHTLLQHGGISGDDEFISLLFLLMEAAALAYLWLSKRAGDAFRDFPQSV